MNSTHAPKGGLHGGLVTDDRTVPPASNLRTVLVEDLFAMVEESKEDIQLEPRPGERAGYFLARLRSSTTPEEGVTFAAYALQPRISVWWAHECLQTMREHLSPVDKQIMDLIAGWAHDPSPENREAIHELALAAPSKTPGVWLGFATAASEGGALGGEILMTTPRAVNAGVLSCLARGGLPNRSINLARFITMAQTLVGE